MNEQDAAYMRRAITLAERGAPWTSPNPLVGAVVVKDGRVIGEGYHERCGGLHAERNALNRCTESAGGATVYVTLEPCCHQGRTPPCTEALIAHKVARVVIGSRDPNPLVSGKGAAMLRAAGIEVVEDFLRDECDALNPIFFHYITTKLPYTALKYAMTADGKLAAYTGASQWITGEEARRHVHSLRSRYRAIMVGTGTVLEDDPMLNCRLEGGRDPVRVVCDSRLRIPLTAKLVATAGDQETIVACAAGDGEKQRALEAAGVTVLRLPGADGRVDLPALFAALGERSIDSVLVEGGGTLHESVLRTGLVRRVYAYIGGLLLGGRAAKTPVGGQGFPSPAEGVGLSAPAVQLFGRDILLDYFVEGGANTDVYGDH